MAFAAPVAARQEQGELRNLTPFFMDIDENHFEEYRPSRVEEKYQRAMQNDVVEALNYRKGFESQWKYAARQYNLLAEQVPDKRLSNILFPLIRIVIKARLSAMADAMPDYNYDPGYDDDDMVQLWKDARRSTDVKTNMDNVMMQALLDMSIFGTGVLWDGYQAAYKTAFIPNESGGFDERVVRDLKRSMIFTRAVSPFHHYISPGGQNQLDAPFQGVTVYMDWDQWVAEFARVPSGDGHPLYMNVNCVRPGKAWLWQKDQNGNYGYRETTTKSKKIAVTYHFNPIQGIHIVESNGVTNWIGPNPYEHGNAPFSMLLLHDQLDRNGVTHALYPMGDGAILAGLNTLWQSVGNMFVDSFYLSNASVIGIPQGLNLDIDDQEFYAGTIIKGGEGLVVNRLGQIDGNAYNFFEILNQFIIWATGVPFNQLTGGETQTTAFELMQKVKMANKDLSYVLKFNESYGLKRHGENRLGNMFQFLPKEDFVELTDPEAVKELVKEKKIRDQDVIYDNGLPVRMRVFQSIKTKGRVLEQKFGKDGKPMKFEMKTIEEGRDGRVEVRPEFFLPTDWRTSRTLPEVTVDSARKLLTLEEISTAQVFRGAEYAIAQNDRARALKQPEPFDESNINEEVVEALGRRSEKWLNRGKSEGLVVGEENLKDIEKEMRDAINEKVGADALASAAQPSMPITPPGSPALQGGENEVTAMRQESRALAPEFASENAFAL